MNAAHTSQLSNFPTARADDKPAPENAATIRQRKADKRARKKRGASIVPVVNDRQCCECLQQAEICREQAQEAARMKRFKAARGLFATAISLCQNALNARALRHQERAAEKALAQNEMGVDDAAISADDDAIQAYLRQLNIEMATYSDLARSMERPLQNQPSPAQNLPKPAR